MSENKPGYSLAARLPVNLLFNTIFSLKLPDYLTRLTLAFAIKITGALHIFNCLNL
jgi:hypothetical protein